MKRAGAAANPCPRALPKRFHLAPRASGIRWERIRPCPRTRTAKRAASIAPCTAAIEAAARPTAAVRARAAASASNRRISPASGEAALKARPLFMRTATAPRKPGSGRDSTLGPATAAIAVSVTNIVLKEQSVRVRRNECCMHGRRHVEIGIPVSVDEAHEQCGSCSVEADFSDRFGLYEGHTVSPIPVPA
jgi:hypothetical protein